MAASSLPLPRYDARAAELFDDEIEPVAVGVGIGDQDVRKDAVFLRERTQTSDAVVRARVVTVTSSPEGDGAGWQIALHTVETLAGMAPPGGDFSLFVDKRAPAAGVVRMLDAHLVGTTFVVFARQFGVEGGARGPVFHFHFAKDDRDELAAVRKASLLGEVR